MALSPISMGFGHEPCEPSWLVSDEHALALFAQSQPTMKGDEFARCFIDALYLRVLLGQCFHAPV